MVSITAEIQYGTYSWCCVLGKHILSVRNPSSTSKRFWDIPKQVMMLRIDISIPEALLSQVDIINVYRGRALVRYTINRPLPKDVTLVIAVGSDTESFPGSILDIKFEKILSRPVGGSIFDRLPMQTILEEQLAVPDIQLKGSSTCAICIEDVEDGDTYVSTCSHKFHMSCIYNYTSGIGLTQPLPPRCATQCEHNKAIVDFKCPVCRKVQQQRETR